jgi:hypothetical protein
MLDLDPAQHSALTDSVPVLMDNAGRPLIDSFGFVRHETDA